MREEGSNRRNLKRTLPLISVDGHLSDVKSEKQATETIFGLTNDDDEYTTACCHIWKIADT